MATLIYDLMGTPVDLSLITSDIIVQIIVVVVLAYILVSAVTFLLSHLAERLPYFQIQIKMIIPFVKIIIYVAALYGIASVISSPYANINELFAFILLFGVILVFGIRDLFSNIVGSTVIMLEKPFQIGDMVTFGEHYGEVIDINLRSTRLITPDRSEVSIPNLNIFNEPVMSGNSGKLVMMVVTDLYIDSRCDEEKALRIARDVAVTSKYAIVSKTYPCTVHLNDFPFYRGIRVRVYVNDIRNEFELKTEITWRSWVEFRKQKIHPPKPQVVVSAGRK
jgi:small-conductance mechanosensitive channel